MTVNTEASVACQTAISYFDDINQEIQKLEQNDNYLLRESEGKAIIDGDLKLFHSEIMRSELHEQPSLLGMYYSCIGRIKELNYAAQIKFGRVDKSIGENARKNLAEAAEAFSSAIAADPFPLYQYSLAFTYLNLDRKHEALQMLELVANGDDSKLAIEARKTIGRIGPVTPVKPDSSSRSNSSDYIETDTSIKYNSSPLIDREIEGTHKQEAKLDYNYIIIGGLALFFGFGLVKLPMIGIPLIIWGSCLIIAYCIKQVDK